MAKRISARLLTSWAAAAVLAGCGATPPHSDYFVVAFLSGAPALSQPGLEALDNAVRMALRSRPRFIAVDGAEPPGSVAPPLEKARGDAIVAAFTKAGIDPRLIELEMRPMTEQGYTERKDSFIVQLGYGAPPHS